MIYFDLQRFWHNNCRCYLQSAPAHQAAMRLIELKIQKY